MRTLPSATRLPEFLSARPVRAATTSRDVNNATNRVSIRATRAGRDPLECSQNHQMRQFLSARPVRAATWVTVPVEPTQEMFLSARPVRAATVLRKWFRRPWHCFYPRDPCGPRRTPSLIRRLTMWVSIRATRAGRDCQKLKHCLLVICFYPRDPCGPRQAFADKVFREMLFLSARPVRAATCPWSTPTGTATLFLSARPVRAATSPVFQCRCQPWCFYPRDPCGPRRGSIPSRRRPRYVSIRATCAGRDQHEI